MCMTVHYAMCTWFDVYYIRPKKCILHFQNVKIERHEKHNRKWNCATVKISPQMIPHSFKTLQPAVRTTPLAISDYHGIRFHKCLHPAHCSLDRINNRLRAFR